MLRLLSQQSLPTLLTYILNSDKITTEALMHPESMGSKNSFDCKPIEEFYYVLTENCRKCSDICLETSRDYKEADCLRNCRDYIVLQPFKNEINAIRQQQNVFFILIILLIILICLRYLYEILQWLRDKGCFKNLFPGMDRYKEKTMHNGKGTINGVVIGGTTIENMCAISDIERAPSQIYSINGVEGSILTMTTPISVRHPAEDTTPTSQQTTEYSYVNEALAVTPTTPAVV